MDHRDGILTVFYGRMILVREGMFLVVYQMKSGLVSEMLPMFLYE
jgi:hypothetical protein